MSQEMSISVSHRPQNNVLMDDGGKPMLCDFGRSRLLGRTAFMTKSGICRSRTLELTPEEEDFNPVTIRGWRWMACELMLDDDAQCIWCTTKQTDVWAFAMTVIEVRIFLFAFFLRK